MPESSATNEIILQAKDLKKWFPVRRRLRQALQGERRWVRAVDGVSFSVRRGEIFGLIGESGCGKTTTGKLVMKLLDPTSGGLAFEGTDATGLDKEAVIAYRRKVQMIFQDPYASMNPRFKIRDVLEEPLLVHGIGKSRQERGDLVEQALAAVKLTPVSDFMGRFPHMLSGGQRQRAATARTLILSPDLLVADEPVSMIDLSTARYFTDRIAVMYLGRIVEIGSPDDVVDHPVHPYTRALIAAVCEPVSGQVDIIKELPIKGEIPSAAYIPEGCRFHPRCVFATSDCSQFAEPELETVGEGHQAACRRWREI